MKAQDGIKFLLLEGQREGKSSCREHGEWGGGEEMSGGRQAGVRSHRALEALGGQWIFILIIMGGHWRV